MHWIFLLNEHASLTAIVIITKWSLTSYKPRTYTNAWCFNCFNFAFDTSTNGFTRRGNWSKNLIFNILTYKSYVGLVPYGGLKMGGCGTRVQWVPFQHSSRLSRDVDKWRPPLETLGQVIRQDCPFIAFWYLLGGKFLLYFTLP